MPPRSQDAICLTACPKHRSQYSWTISYALVSHRGTWAICRDVRAREERRRAVCAGLGVGGCQGSRQSWQDG